jgi:hypothetical protein
LSIVTQKPAEHALSVFLVLPSGPKRLKQRAVFTSFAFRSGEWRLAFQAR